MHHRTVLVFPAGGSWERYPSDQVFPERGEGSLRGACEDPAGQGVWCGDGGGWRSGGWQGEWSRCLVW